MLMPGLIHSEHGVYTEYVDSRRDEWQMKILPALKQISIADLVRESGISRSALFDVLAGRSRPHPRNQKKLTEIARALGPRSVGLRSVGPRSVGPRSVGPRSVGPRSVGPRSVGSRSVGSRSVCLPDGESDIIIPSSRTGGEREMK
jgi:hypothetical protein